jgi:hypothetical protein
MKYIKTFESEEIESRLKAEEYRKYIGKYVIFKYIVYGIKQDFYIAHCSESHMSKQYFDLDIITSSNEVQNKYIDSDRLKSLSYHREAYVLDFKILDSFDTFEEAKENFEFLLDTNKYNL